jgi:hypothetical protein
MNVFGNLFKSNKVECPRCLGKGDVDTEDIKRLKLEVKWLPGLCAYCNGKGVVSEKFISDFAVDTNYLTVEMTPRERKRIINKDEGALKEVEYEEALIDEEISEILYLHRVGNLNPQQILDFYFLNMEESLISEEHQKQFLEHIIRVIKFSE